MNCDNCNNIQNYYGTFYSCSCKQVFCPLCLSEHKNHSYIEYNKILIDCKEHNIEFKLYFNSCNKNLCPKCEAEHQTHKILFYKSIINTKKLNAIYEEIKLVISEIDKFNIELNNYKEKFNEYIDNTKNKI